MTHQANWTALFRSVERSEFFASFAETAAECLAREYYHSVERYDRSVCTGRIYAGCIMPATPAESRLINRNATATLRRIEDKGLQLGISAQDLYDTRIRLLKAGREMEGFECYTP